VYVRESKRAKGKTIRCGEGMGPIETGGRGL
jgi:hypothetical protein